MNLQHALNAYAWNLRYAEALAADIPLELHAKSGGPGLENHAAWTLGHLVTGSAMLAEDLGLDQDLPGGWSELFERRGPGDPSLPDPDPTAYPPLPDILAELRRQHTRVKKAWLAIEAKRLAEHIDWRFDRDLPTLADASVFLAVTHEAMHLGQLAAWRRAHGLPSALASL